MDNGGKTELLKKNKLSNNVSFFASIFILYYIVIIVIIFYKDSNMGSLVKLGLAKFDTIRTQYGFYGFGLSIIVFWLYLC